MNNMFKIVEKTKIWFSVSIILILIGLIFFGVKGLNYGIDFKGGSVVKIQIGKQLTNQDIADIRNITAKYDSKADARIVEGKDVEITSSTLSDADAPKLFADIKAKYNLKDTDLLSTDRIGPSVGKELRQKAMLSVIFASIGILLYTTIRFEFKSGVAAVVALIHDLLIMFGVYTVFQISVNSSFIAAMLTILGYSINDTIVVFDRIRENKRIGRYGDYKTLVNGSITQTMARSINTVLTTLITITCVYTFGVSSIKDFAFPLIIGIVSGCYSSIFIASPLWYLMVRKEKLNTKAKTA